MTTNRTLAGAALLLCIGSTGAATDARAQVTEVARTSLVDQAHITFGDLCGDRFVVRNDGTQPVALEYGVQNGAELSHLSLSVNESVELSSSGNSAVQLWMNGHVIAQAANDKRLCATTQGDASVNVAPLITTPAPNTVLATPYLTVYPSAYPFYDPWAYGYGFGAYPYVGVSIRSPIVIGARVGVGHFGGFGRRR